MQIAGLSYSSAPQTMAQAIGLPGAGDNKHSVTEIQPILDARRPETKLGSADSPLAFWNAVPGGTRSGDAHATPVDHADQD